MGKTPEKLRCTLYVYHPWLGQPALVALAEKGHTLSPLALDDADLILHPAAHAWGDWGWDKPAYLEAALKRCRDRKRVAK